MNASLGHIEVFAHKWCHRWNVIAHFLPEVFPDFRDHRRIHAVQRTLQGSIFKYHGFQRNISCSLPDAQQGAVYGAGAVQPCSGCIGNGLVEIIVSVPFQHFARNTGIVLQTVNNTGYASRQAGFRIRYAVAHGVAGTDFDRNPNFLRQIHNLIDERYHETVEISPRNVFQMAPRHHAGVKGILDGFHVEIHGLTAGHVHLFENVIVTAGYQDAGFLDAKVTDQAEILLAGADPARDFRELEAQFHALVDGLPVLLRIDEEF